MTPLSTPVLGAAASHLASPAKLEALKRRVYMIYMSVTFGGSLLFWLMPPSDLTNEIRLLIRIVIPCALLFAGGSFLLL